MTFEGEDSDSTQLLGRQNIADKDHFSLKINKLLDGIKIGVISSKYMNDK